MVDRKFRLPRPSPINSRETAELRVGSKVVCISIYDLEKIGKLKFRIAYTVSDIKGKFIKIKESAEDIWYIKSNFQKMTRTEYEVWVHNSKFFNQEVEETEDILNNVDENSMWRLMLRSNPDSKGSLIDYDSLEVLVNTYKKSMFPLARIQTYTFDITRGGFCKAGIVFFNEAMQIEETEC